MTPHASEHVIAVVPAHWVRYVRVGVIIALVGFCDAVLFVLAGVFAGHNAFIASGLSVAALTLLLLLHHWTFAVLASASMQRVIITNHRVVSYGVRLLLHEELKEVAFERMKSVDVVMDGFWPNLLRYGSLVFEEKIGVHDVPHPNRVARAIEQAQGLR